MTGRMLFVSLLVVLAAFPTCASGAAVPDRVADEVSGPIDVGIDGSVVAYAHRVGTRGVEVVVRDGSKPAVRLDAGRRESPIGVGRDRAGRRVVVYLRCGGTCDLVAYSPSAKRSRVVDEGFARATDLAVGKGRVFWIVGRRAFSRPLGPGKARREAVVANMDPRTLDSDGTTLAVVGDLPGEFDGGATGVSITRDRAVFVEAPSDAGCALGSDFLEQIIARVPCRIVVADLARERILPPRIAIDERVATVVRTKVRGSKITGRLALAGVAVEVRDSDEQLIASLTTDARGKVTLPEADGDGLAVSAATTPRSYAYDSGR